MNGPLQDGTAADATPEVVVPAGRPAIAYARTGNLLLPLRFARQMPEWTRPSSHRLTSWRRSRRPRQAGERRR